MRLWTEFQNQRTFSTPDGPMFVYRDETVVIAVVRNKDELAALLAAFTGDKIR